MATQVTVQENVTSITIDAATSITVNEDVTTLEISAGAAGANVASSIGVTPYGTIASTNVQAALQELADDFSDKMEHLVVLKKEICGMIRMMMH